MGINHRSRRAVIQAAAARRARALALATLAALAATGLWAWPSSAQAAPPPPLVVATLVVQPGAANAMLTLDGVLEPVRQATLSSQVGGNVLQLVVKAGDAVRAGQVVAWLDGRELAAALQASQAALAQAQAQQRNARLQAERSRSLQAQGFVSQAALDIADTSAQAANAAVQQAQAALRQAQLTQGHAQVLAPFDGTFLATHVQAGDLATPGRPIATLYAPGALRALVQVPASLASAARSAKAVQVLLADGRAVVPVAQQWLPGADAVAQTLAWRLDLPAAVAATLQPGQAVQVLAQGGGAAVSPQAVPTFPPAGTLPASSAGTLPASSASTLPVSSAGMSAASSAGLLPAAIAPAFAPLVLPASALLQRGELTAVYVVQGQRFVLRAVRTGARHGAAGTEVLAGLRAGERVALHAVQAGLAGAVPAP